MPIFTLEPKTPCAGIPRIPQPTPELVRARQAGKEGVRDSDPVPVAGARRQDAGCPHPAAPLPQHPQSQGENKNPTNTARQVSSFSMHAVSWPFCYRTCSVHLAKWKQVI